MTEVINYLTAREKTSNKTIREKVESVTKQKKENGIKALIIETRYILEYTNKSSMFVSICLISVFLFIVGMFISIRMENYFLLPVTSIGFATLPFQYIKFNNIFYKKRLNNELETSLSVITSSYERTKNIINAVDENLNTLNPPISDIFRSFKNETQLLKTDVKESLEELKYKVNNDIFDEWIDTVIMCQDDVNLIKSLRPIITKFADIRITSAELDTHMFAPLREFILIVVIAYAQIPMIYFLNKDWFNVLFFTTPGKLSIVLTVTVTFVSFFNIVKLTKPIEAKMLMEE
jgi:protein associated with RNAse G/E|nr:hypothetical protein [Clostridioides sp.]